LKKQENISAGYFQTPISFDWDVDTCQRYSLDRRM